MISSLIQVLGILLILFSEKNNIGIITGAIISGIGMGIKMSI